VQRAYEVVGETLDRRVARGGSVTVRRDIVGDRVQEVGLAETGRAADEERVVCETRHLGDRQRCGVCESIGIADHELVEGEARIESLAAAGRGLIGGRRRCVSQPHLGSRIWALFLGDHTDLGFRSHDGLGTGSQQTSEPVRHPALIRPRCGHDDGGLKQLAELKRLEPEVPGGVGDGLAQLGADKGPGVVGCGVGQGRVRTPLHGVEGHLDTAGGSS